jgi:hypothetical protein
MSNENSKLDALTDIELDAATGGLVVNSVIGILVGLLLPAVNQR